MVCLYRTADKGTVYFKKNRLPVTQQNWLKLDRTDRADLRLHSIDLLANR